MITIAGCGPGAPRLITPAARAAALEARLLVGSERLLACFPEAAGERMAYRADTAAMLTALESGPRPACVLVSGDPGLCSLARPVLDRFGATCRIIPGVSSVQAAFAAAGLDWLGSITLSCHGRRPPAVDTALLRTLPAIAVLCGDREALRWIAVLHAELGDCRRLVVCENLTLPEERIRTVAATELPGLAIASLTIVLLIGDAHA
jgi:precorrin-6y C5,15-methyltransferase (decarboxylating) CbiE subunit